MYVSKVIYALRPESFCAWISAVQKVFTFCVSGCQETLSHLRYFLAPELTLSLQKLPFAGWASHSGPLLLYQCNGLSFVEKLVEMGKVQKWPGHPGQPGWGRFCLRCQIPRSQWAEKNLAPTKEPKLPWPVTHQTWHWERSWSNERETVPGSLWPFLADS